MRVDHSVYRSFFSERRLEAATGFLDGDLIETVVEMSRELLMKIIDGMKYKKTDDGGSEMDFVTPEDVLKIIDDLAQIY
jgi:DNA damage-binding protein 1